LLQRAGRERRIRFADLLALFEVGHAPGGRAELLAQVPRRLLVDEQYVRIGLQPAGMLVEILADRDSLSRQAIEIGLESSLRGRFEAGFEVPVGPLAEGPPLAFAEHDEAYGDRLHTAG